MAFNRKYILFTALIPIFIVQNYTGSCQKLSDTLNLRQVEIRASFATHNQGFKKVKIDSLVLEPQINSDLATILSQHSTVFIKSYGNGSLSTPSIRGTSAIHTQVEWNGINITSPMLGQMDFSIVPVLQFDEVEIFYGAATISRSSGAFGGTINLVSRPDWDNRIKVYASQSAGSFQTYNTDLRMNLGTPNFQSGTRFNYSSSVNNFTYYNDQTFRTEKLRNSSYYEAGLSQDLFYNIKNRDFFTIRAWYSEDFRNIPPITTNHDTSHIEHQEDKNFRGLAEWQHVLSKYSITVRTAYVDQYMDYVNDSLNAHHHSYKWINRLRFSWSVTTFFIFKTGVDYDYDKVKSDDYNGLKTRNTIAGFTEFQYHAIKKLDFALILREDNIDNKFQPLIATLGSEYKPFNKINLAITANVARNYRFPTLNELYWNLYGNPDLKPETDYSGELGLVHSFFNRKGTFFIETSLTGFYSDMLNLIVWLPQANNSSIWKPVNFKEVHASGIECVLNMSYKVSGFAFKWICNYTYCRSTNMTGLSDQDASTGKQLIYTPLNNINSSLSGEKSGFFISYDFLYTGIRYTSTDNLSYMAAYNLSNLIFRKSFFLKKIVLSLQIEINNLFDLDFQSIANRPMPGRYYTGTLTFRFKK